MPRTWDRPLGLAVNVQPRPHRILGIDPGLNTTGYGVLKFANGKLHLCEAGVVRGRARGSLTGRLHQIYDGVAEVIESLHPDVMALEELYSHYGRPRTALLMAHARGVVLLGAAQRNIHVLNIPSTTVKRHLTGNGRAGKEQVQKAVSAHLELPYLPHPADVSDALAVAICAAAMLRQPARLAMTNDDLLSPRGAR